MRIDENTIYYIYCIYEHGEYHHSLRKLEINISIDRNRVREIITHFINKYCTIQDNKHPIFSLHPIKVKELLDMLQSEGKGAKLKLDDDGPSVF